MNGTKKSKKTKEDTISQLKKEEQKAQKDSKKEEEEEYHQDSEEEETNTKETEVKEQTVQKTDKPKSLKELLNTVDENKPKDKKKQEKKHEKKPKKYYDEEPPKLKFTNSKRKGNADDIDKEIRAKKEPEKKTFTNAQGLSAAAKENEKIKPTKNYLEKDTKKKYNDEKEEEISKPKFTTNIKDGDENFVELNKNEDVSKYKYII